MHRCVPPGKNVGLHNMHLNHLCMLHCNQTSLSLHWVQKHTRQPVIFKSDNIFVFKMPYSRTEIGFHGPYNPVLRYSWFVTSNQHGLLTNEPRCAREAFTVLLAARSLTDRSTVLLKTTIFRCVSFIVVSVMTEGHGVRCLDFMVWPSSWVGKEFCNLSSMGHWKLMLKTWS
jgi:hypothetical protein